MTSVLVVAGGLIILLAAVHSLLGERRVFPRLNSLPEPVRASLGERRLAALRSTWHIVSIIGCGLAALLFWFAWARAEAVTTGPLVIIAATFFVSAVFWLYGTRGRHPAWIVLLLTAGLTMWAAI